MAQRVLIVQAHPDNSQRHLCHALADAYAEGASSGGHELRVLDVAEIDFPLLRSKAQWEGPVPPSLLQAQADILWAGHLVFVFPLWLGGMPALLKGFLEQVARPGFAIGKPGAAGLPHKLLAGRSARLIVTMGMPALVYRYYFRAHSVKSLERNVLGFVGIAPVHETLIGMVERTQDKERERWLGRLRELGRNAA